MLAYDRWVLALAIDWVKLTGDTYPFDKLVGPRFPLDVINQAFEPAEWTAGTGSVARTVFVP